MAERRSGQQTSAKNTEIDQEQASKQKKAEKERILLEGTEHASWSRLNYFKNNGA